MTNEPEFIVEVARLIAKQGMTIDEFYAALGADLDSHRLDAGDVVAELAGIFKGWENAPPQGLPDSHIFGDSVSELD